MTRLVRLLAALLCLGTFVALIAHLPTFLLPWILWFLAASALAAYLWPGGRTVYLSRSRLVHLCTSARLTSKPLPITWSNPSPSHRPTSSKAFRERCPESICRRSAWRRTRFEL